MNTRKLSADTLSFGWSAADLTPRQPVLIAGQFHARISEGVADPLSATALALSRGTEHAVLVGCDLVSIPDAFRDKVRRSAAEQSAGLDPQRIVLSATHTHTAPEIRATSLLSGTTSVGLGVDLDVQPVAEYADWAAQRVADCVVAAWDSRKVGAAAFGLGYAVVGFNRRCVDRSGRSTMYGETDVPGFSHMEGSEDHTLNVLSLYDAEKRLTGMVVNVPCPSQVTAGAFTISADYWYETRRELRKRFGQSLFILPQCSAAGDLSPRALVDKSPQNRMLELKGRTLREDIAVRIGDAVDDVLRFSARTADSQAILLHRSQTLALPGTVLLESDAAAAAAEAARLERVYLAELDKLARNPDLRRIPRWYVGVTQAFREMSWNRGVVLRYRQQTAGSPQPAEIHAIRLGDMAFATNPFEAYLDYGMYIKARSPAQQTFVVQLAGNGSYLPTRRSLAGGGYGSVPASNPVGPEGGERLAERSVEQLFALWDKRPSQTT